MFSKMGWSRVLLRYGSEDIHQPLRNFVLNHPITLSGSLWLFFLIIAFMFIDPEGGFLYDLHMARVSKVVKTELNPFKGIYKKH